MSWPVAAYGLLGLTLLAGFAWYEWTKPDAKVIALVGALAAFAALGRVAFAAVPNVKPTTDIVIIAGFTLGGAPGFTVGAVAALSSNFFFGQGPWTPWQMLGWGCCGVIGALLGRGPSAGVFGRRWPLAVACGLLGFAFTAFQDVGDWVTYSDHSLAELGTYVSTGVGFDAVSAVAGVGFALLFGPALVHSLRRFRLRLNVQWVAPVLIIGVALAITPTRAQAAQTPQTPVAYLQRAPLTTPLYSGWAALGLESARVIPPARLIAYIRRTQADDPGSLERSILVLAPLGDSVSALIKRLHFTPAITDQTNLTAFGVLALRAAHRAVPAATLHWLRAQEDADGGFNFATRGPSSDVDDTGAVLEALGDVPRAVRFLELHENSDGGFPADPGESSNAQSTAFAVQGLIAAGQHPARAIAYLRRLIQPNGSIDYATRQSQTPEWVTGEALMATRGAPLPLKPLAVSASVSAPVSRTTTDSPTPPVSPPGVPRAAPGPASPQPLARPAPLLQRAFSTAARLVRTIDLI